MTITQIIKSPFQQVLKDKRNGRRITSFDDDTYLTSYPKSGNTWLRYLIGNLLYNDVTFKNLEERIPDIYINREKFLIQTPRPRILKSHEYFHPKYKKVVYIVRDPRSVAVSYFYYLKKFNKLPQEIDIHSYVDLFVQGKLDRYATWNENVLSWNAFKEDSDRILIVKYEDLKDDTFSELTKISNFLQINASEQSLINAIEKSSVKKMKSDEKANSATAPILKGSDKNIPFVRSAKKDEWQTALSEIDIVKIENAFKQGMNIFGYLK